MYYRKSTRVSFSYTLVTAIDKSGSWDSRQVKMSFINATVLYSCCVCV